MLRIKTIIGENRIYTLLLQGKWITLISINGRSTSSVDASNLYDAGNNHLSACMQIKQLSEYHHITTPDEEKDTFAF